ncbi:SDR family oxidoreductase [Ramlibacter sp. AN1015]|uniref:SDR family oxidoreductase n=1 Tax=Ramlibacter sp. AN1015 TaxID=3133428 RepID=UPI0030C19A34
MRILITGATGFIGRSLALALLHDGHELVCAVRDPARLDLPPGRWRALQADLARVPDRSWWQHRLQGMDAVVNAVGIIREAPGQSFAALHERAPSELFHACAAAGVGVVVQISALGADAQAHSRYHLSKRAADDTLRALPLRGAVVQPSLVYGVGGASAALFNRMAAAPMLALPRAGRMEVQPVLIDDVVAGIRALLAQPPQEVRTIAFVGPAPMPLADYLRGLRRALRIAGPLPVLPLPVGLFLMGARLAGRLPGSLLDAETAGMLLQGNAAPAQAFQALLGRPPRGVPEFVPATLAEGVRARAVLDVWLPVLRVALAFLWIWTAVVSLGLYPLEGSYALLARVGLSGWVATVALYGAALLDLVLGLLTLACPSRWRRLLWLAQLGLIGGYTLLITVFLPEYWLHPYGPISKNLPIVAALGLLWALEPAPRLRR